MGLETGVLAQQLRALNHSCSEFCSQNLFAGSQPSGTLVPEDLTPPYTEYMQANAIKRKKLTKNDLHTGLV